MKTYLAYIRVSTARQGERGSSLAEQRSAIEAYAARHGLTISRWFEEMETAAKQGRGAFGQLLSELKAKRAAGLVIHKIDRSARNLRDWADLGDLIDRGIDVRFVSDNFDLLSRGGRLSADIQAVVAADYIRNLREEVKKGIYGRLKQGLYPFRAPIGYQDNGGGAPKTIDPVTGPLVRELFERYATSTVGFDALRQEMWDKGLSAAGGKVLARSTLTKILNNPFYMGVVRLGTTGETFSGVHEPLISKGLFDRVQAVLQGRTAPKAKRHEFLFRQMIRCSSCGRRTFTGEWQKGRAYYRCHACPGASCRGDALERALLDTLGRVRLSERDVRELRDLVEHESKSVRDHQKELETALKLRLANLEERLNRLTDLLVDGTIDREAHNARREQLLMERQAILGELAQVKRHSPLHSLFEEFERGNGQILGYNSLVDDEKRELIRIACSNLSVSGKSIEIALRSPYKEIAEINDFQKCGHRRDDVRTSPSNVFLVLKAFSATQLSSDRQVRGP